MTFNLAFAFRSLRHRNYRLFFTGQLISLIGTWMQTVSQAWLVYRLTGSAELLGLVGFASQIPVFLLSPFGGTLADRFNKHRILVGTQTSAMLLAFTLAILTLTGNVAVWHIVTLASLLGVVNAFDIPTRQSFIVEMVGKPDLLNAIALNSSMFNSARIVGPAIAGILVASIGEGWCFFANGISYIAVIIGLMMMTLAPRGHRPAEMHGSSVLSKILGGFRYVGRTKPIRAVLLLMGLVSLLGMPYQVLMPIFADRIFHMGSRGLGILMGAMGAGALTGALTLALRTGVKGLARWISTAAICFGISLIIFSESRVFALSLAILFCAGLSMMVQMASSNTLIQAMVPDTLRGRVMAVYSMMFMGMAPFGALMAGALAEHFGAPTAVLFGGCACIIGAMPFTLRLPHLKAEAEEMIVAQEMVAGEPAEEAPGPVSL
jgi:MFS family permease